MIKKLHFIFLLISSFTFSQSVVINELDCDTPGTDALEFIEFRTFTPNSSLNGYVLIFFNDGTGTSYQTFDLDGITTDINGIATLGSVAVQPAPDRNAPDNFVQNGPDAVAIYQLNTAPTNGKTPAQIIGLGGVLIDALIYKSNVAGNVSAAMMSDLNETVQYNENINTNAVNESIQRKDDGTYEIKTPTPDVPNDGSGTFNYLRTSITPTGNQTEGTSFTINFVLDNNVNSGTLTFSYTLANGTFTTGDYTGNLSVSIPAGSNSASRVITLVDDTSNEGDETMQIKIGTLSSSAFSIFNNNIDVRIHDNDYIIQPWGRPTEPTYGLCPNLKPANYYASLVGLTGNALRNAIKTLVSNPSVVRYQTYGDVWDMLKEADTDPKNSSNVWLMYVEHPSSKLDQQTGTSGAIGFWNREHIFCQSRGDYDIVTALDSNADGMNTYTLTTGASDIYAGGSDAHHIRAEDSPENSVRNNRNYGVDYNGPAGNLSTWKGDVARACFYMACRYDGLDVVNGDVAEHTGKIGDLATLLNWNTLDTSDDFEMNRNNIIYNWQQNRNPFIDHPDLADHIWGTKVGIPWSPTLSNQSFSDVLDIKMYPNPANDYISFSGLNQVAKVEIVSITGVKIFEGDYEPESRLSLDLASGIYVVKVTEDNKSCVKKLIVR